MLRVNSLSLAFGSHTVLSDVSFTLDQGCRTGLVGPNGSGKSSLLRLLAGDLMPDTGTVRLDPHYRAAYLPQHPATDLHRTVQDVLREASGRIGELQGRGAALETALAGRSGVTEALLAEYAQAQSEFEALGGYSLETQMEKVVAGLGIAADLATTVDSLSGGTKTKLSLARLLLSEADLLLMDEPTNYLDLPAVLWLEQFVADRDHSYVVVSHDRRFLDATVDSILEINPGGGTVRQWPGTYSDYAAGRERERKKQLAAYRDQQIAVARIEQDIRRTREQARHVETATNNDVLRRYAKKVARKAVVRERRLRREMESGERVEKPMRGWDLDLADLNHAPITDNRLVLEITDLRAGYGSARILNGVSLVLRGRDRVALLGENGSGKTTLLRCIRGELSHDGAVRLGPAVRPGILSQEQAELPLHRTVLDVFRSGTEMREDEARTYLHKFLFAGDQPLNPIAALSYGQRAKLALAMLVLSDANFLILDEPTSHLDVPALEVVEVALAQYVGPILVVSHDRAFLDTIGINRVLRLEQGTVAEVEAGGAYGSVRNVTRAW